MEESAASGPARKRRSPRRPQRQQIVLRRALALGAGLLVLILVVIGVKGCLDARKNRALSDYANDVTQIVEETQQTSKGFFGKLADPGELSVTEFVAEVNADRSAMDNYQSRIDGLDAPGDMSHAQSALELVYDLRASAMNEIADQIDTALGDVGSEKATLVISRQMEKLMASDVVYATVVRPEINRVLADNGIEGEDPPESVFLPEETKWLDESAVDSALGSVNGSSTGEVSGVHGVELIATAINGTELSSESASEISLEEETPEVEVTVQNQGESTENGITVSVSYSGGGPLEGTISTLEVEASETVSIPLVPAPTGEVTLEVEVQAVPGESLTENNEATYTVLFK